MTSDHNRNGDSQRLKDVKQRRNELYRCFGNLECALILISNTPNIISVEEIYSKVCNKSGDSMLQIINLCKNREKHNKHGLIKKWKLNTLVSHNWLILCVRS